jgi:hypothetical protein
MLSGGTPGKECQSGSSLVREGSMKGRANASYIAS